MKVTKLEVISRFVGNGSPAGGYAVFNDGKSYSWGSYGGKISLYGHRLKGGENEMFRFQSPSREAAITEAINSI
ncbi:hypothetical protein [Mesorhizobium sp. CN2-181]|uniref:hypothetical protein n=1 Tax=Mesorhizobium yinganensis TaxID=3157707 RepID=UPI0032B76D09